MSFDITSMANWQPRRYMCNKCRAVFSQQVYTQTKGEETDRIFYNPEKNGFYCPICKNISHSVNYRNIAEPQEEQIKGLGQIASKLPPHKKLTEEHQGEYLNLVIDAISKSKNFIHFLTYNIDTTFLSLLYLASRFTSVRGIIAGTPWKSESSRFNRSLYETFNDTSSREMHFEMYIDDEQEENHAKLIVIDGLIALSGSVNLSFGGYRKVSSGKELPRVESNPDKVIELNNSCFAKQWAKRKRALSRAHVNSTDTLLREELDMLFFDPFPEDDDLPF